MEFFHPLQCIQKVLTKSLFIENSNSSETKEPERGQESSAGREETGSDEDRYLHVFVHSAEGLRKADIGFRAKSDPFVELILKDENGKDIPFTDRYCSLPENNVLSCPSYGAVLTQSDYFPLFFLSL